jgi:hypothetical protein
MVGDATEYGRQVSLWIDLIQFRRTNQTVPGGGTLTTGI